MTIHDLFETEKLQQGYIYRVKNRKGKTEYLLCTINPLATENKYWFINSEGEMIHLCGCWNYEINEFWQYKLITGNMEKLIK